MLIGGTGRFARRAAAMASGGTSTDFAGAAVVRRPWNVATLDADDLCAIDSATGSWLEICGNPIIEGQPHRAEWLLRTLRERGFPALAQVEGAFALVWWDAPRGRLVLLRDRFGAEPF